MRSFKSAFCADFLPTYQAGTLKYRYRDVPCLKSPIDLAIYMSMLWRERPRTLIEIGSKHGGSALFFADMARIFELETNIVSIDLSPPDTVADDRIRFLQGDVMHLGDAFMAHSLFELPRPWTVIEDSAHTKDGCAAALTFFAENLLEGELLVMEDGILTELGMSDRYEGGPNRAIENFFLGQPDVFEIATEYADMFGINATYNPNGYLRRCAFSGAR